MLQSPDLAGLPHVRHGFFGRAGGVSQGMFAGLNCGFGSADDPKHVRENRRRAAAALEIAESQLLTAYQIHSPEAVYVERPWAQGGQPRADAMVTDRPGIALGILAADCAPVLLADSSARVIGAAHAGWKGALAGVLESALALMERHGAARARIAAAIGPCISQASYEVGPEFRARFAEAEPDSLRFFTPSIRDGHHRFDLPGYAAARLERAGVGAVRRLDACTYANPGAYFSYRRATHRGESDYGRNLSAIVLAEPS